MKDNKNIIRKNPRVTVIVINYNGKHLLDDCLSSLKSQSYKHYRVWIHDSQSSDGSIEYIKEKYPWVGIIQSDGNYGTAGGSNEAAGKTDSEYIVFMSNDIKVDRNCLKYLVKTLDDDKTIGLCSSKLLRSEKDKKVGKYLIDNVGGDLDIYGFGSPRGLGEAGGKWEEKKDVFFSCGGSFIIRRKLFEKIGGYDSKYFTLGDDIDLSWRVWLVGSRVVVNPASFIYHKGSATLGPLYQRPQKRYWSERNTLRTLLKNYEGKNLLLILSKYFLIEMMEMGYFLFLKRQPRVLFALTKAFCWNLLYFPDTLKQREIIQKIRVVEDKEILKMMSKKSFKMELYKNI